MLIGDRPRGLTRFEHLKEAERGVASILDMMSLSGVSSMVRDDGNLLTITARNVAYMSSGLKGRILIIMVAHDLPTSPDYNTSEGLTSSSQELFDGPHLVVEGSRLTAGREESNTGGALAG